MPITPSSSIELAESNIIRLAAIYQKAFDTTLANPSQLLLPLTKGLKFEIDTITTENGYLCCFFALFHRMMEHSEQFKYSNILKKTDSQKTNFLLFTQAHKTYEKMVAELAMLIQDYPEVACHLLTSIAGRYAVTYLLFCICQRAPQYKIEDEQAEIITNFINDQQAALPAAYQTALTFVCENSVIKYQPAVNELFTLNDLKTLLAAPTTSAIEQDPDTTEIARLIRIINALNDPRLLFIKELPLFLEQHIRTQVTMLAIQHLSTRCKSSPQLFQTALQQISQTGTALPTPTDQSEGLNALIGTLCFWQSYCTKKAAITSLMGDHSYNHVEEITFFSECLLLNVHLDPKWPIANQHKSHYLEALGWCIKYTQDDLQQLHLLKEKQLFEIAPRFFIVDRVVDITFIKKTYLYLPLLLSQWTTFESLKHAFRFLLQCVEYGEIIHYPLTKEQKALQEALVVMYRLLYFFQQALQASKLLDTPEEQRNLLVEGFTKCSAIPETFPNVYALLTHPKTDPHMKTLQQKIPALFSLLLTYLFEGRPFVKPTSEEADALLHLHAIIERIYQSFRLSEEQHQKLRKLFNYEALLKVREEKLLILFQEEDTISEVTTSPTKKKTKPRKRKAIAASPSSKQSASSIDASAAPTFFDQTPTIHASQLPAGIKALAEMCKSKTGNPLLLTGGAVVDLFLKKPWQRINDFDCLLPSLPLHELQACLAEVDFIKSSTIVGKTYPTLRLTLEEGDATYQVEISTFKTTLREHLLKIDFKIAALYLEMNGPTEHLEIKGIAGAVKSLRNKRIGLVTDSKSSFIKDPICLFRLAKSQLKYPEFALDGYLIHVLRELNVPQCLKTFLRNKTNGSTHQGRIGTALTQLLDRFEPRAVMSCLNEIGILTAMTEFDLPTINCLLEIFYEDITETQSGQQKKEMFYITFTAFYLYREGHEKLQQWDFYRVAKHLPPATRTFYDYLKQQICGVETTWFFSLPHIDRVIEKVRPIAATLGLKPNAAASTPSV